jgi:dTMP kinase
MSPGRGLFITFEGPDGSGKTVQVELLGRALAGNEPLLLREPGGTPLGEEIRNLLLHSDHMSHAAEMYLFMAARAELLSKKILPALEGGRIVIADRYHDSTIAYQGGGRGIDATWPPHFPKPDLTVLLEISAAEGQERMRSAGKALDRLDAESMDFHRRAERAYDRIAAAEPARFLRVDGASPAGEIHRLVLGRVQGMLAGRPA